MVFLLMLLGLYSCLPEKPKSNNFLHKSPLASDSPDRLDNISNVPDDPSLEDKGAPADAAGWWDKDGAADADDAADADETIAEQLAGEDVAELSAGSSLEVEKGEVAEQPLLHQDIQVDSPGQEA
jgi:hypothetical protein